MGIKQFNPTALLDFPNVIRANELNPDHETRRGLDVQTKCPQRYRRLFPYVPQKLASVLGSLLVIVRKSVHHFLNCRMRICWPPLLLNLVSSPSALTLYHVCVKAVPFDRFSADMPEHEILQYSLQSVYALKRNLHSTIKQFSVFKWNVSPVCYSQWIHAPANVGTTTYKQIENTVCVAEKREFYFHKGRNPRELLVKMKNEEENTTGINAAERYFYLLWRSKSLQSNDCGKRHDILISFNRKQKRQQREALEESQIKCIVWRRRTMQ